MPNRSLVTTVLIVWAIAAVVALVFGAPMLLIVLGVHIDAGLIINAMAALGAFSAAAAAVWVATTDRRERRLKDEAADEARAKLVILSTARPEGRSRLDVIVRNLGPEPVVDLIFVPLDVEGHQLDLVPSRHSHFPVLTDPGQDQNRKEFIIGLQNNGDPFRKALTGHYDPPIPLHVPPPPDANWIKPTITADTILTAAVQFKDLNGNTWQRTASNKAVGEDRLDESLRMGAVRRLR